MIPTKNQQLDNFFNLLNLKPEKGVGIISYQPGNLLEVITTLKEQTPDFEHNFIDVNSSAHPRFFQFSKPNMLNVHYGFEGGFFSPEILRELPDSSAVYRLRNDLKQYIHDSHFNTKYGLDRDQCTELIEMIDDIDDNYSDIPLLGSANFFYTLSCGLVKEVITKITQSYLNSLSRPQFYQGRNIVLIPVELEDALIRYQLQNFISSSVYQDSMGRVQFEGLNLHSPSPITTPSLKERYVRLNDIKSVL